MLWRLAREQPLDAFFDRRVIVEGRVEEPYEFSLLWIG
jgi:hypothetical protein